MSVEGAICNDLTLIALWGYDEHGMVVEASFDGYERQSVSWRDEGALHVADDVTWICQARGGPRVRGWGLADDERVVTVSTFDGDGYDLHGGDTLTLTPRMTVTVSLR